MIHGFLLRWLALFFVAYAAPLVAFHAVNMPVFTNVDETNHVMRAHMVQEGRLLGERRIHPESGKTEAGGIIDDRLLTLLSVYWPLLAEPERRVDPAMIEQGAAVRWHGAEVFVHIPNVAIYPPTLYLPVSVGLGLGKAVGLGVEQSIILARLVAGGLCIALSALALHLAARGRLVLFTVLLFPMTLGQFGAATQDGLLIAGGVLLGALASRPLTEGRAATDREFVAMAVVLTLISMSRPTNLALLPLLFAVAPLVTGAISALGATLLAGGLSVAWVLTALAVSHVPQELTPGVFPSIVGQLGHMLTAPLAFPQAVLGTIADNPGATFLSLSALLGWGGIQLTMPFLWYDTALVILPLAIAAEMLGRRGVRDRQLVAVWVALLGAVVTIYLFQYLTFSPVGADRVGGVQGRYFIPLLALVGLGVPALGARLPERLVAPIRAGAALAVVLFPLSTLLVMPRMTILRLYAD